MTDSPSGRRDTTRLVTFSDGVTVLGTSNVVGTQAQFTTSALGGGSHSITAAYSGDNFYLPSTSPALNQTVNKAATMTTVKGSRTVRRPCAKTSGAESPSASDGIRK